MKLPMKPKEPKNYLFGGTTPLRLGVKENRASVALLVFWPLVRLEWHCIGASGKEEEEEAGRFGSGEAMRVAVPCLCAYLTTQANHSLRLWPGDGKAYRRGRDGAKPRCSSQASTRKGKRAHPPRNQVL